MEPMALRQIYRPKTPFYKHPVFWIIFAAVITVIIGCVVISKKKESMNKVISPEVISPELRELGNIRVFTIECKPQIIAMLSNLGFEGGVTMSKYVYDLLYKNYGHNLVFTGFYPLRDQNYYDRFNVPKQFNCILTTALVEDGHIVSQSEKGVGFADDYYSGSEDLFLKALMEKPRLDRFIQDLQKDLSGGRAGFLDTQSGGSVENESTFCSIRCKPEVMCMLYNYGFEGGVNTVRNVHALFRKNGTTLGVFEGIVSTFQNENLDGFLCSLIVTKKRMQHNEMIIVSEEGTTFVRHKDDFFNDLLNSPRLTRKRAGFLDTQSGVRTDYQSK